MNEGVVSAELGLGGWPAVAEESIIARDVLLAEHVGSRVHICHLSTAGSVEIVRWAKSRGWRRDRRGHPAPPAAHRRAGAHATTRSTRSTRRCAPSATCWPCARRSPTAPSTSSPPTTPAPARGQGLRVGRRRHGHGRPGDRAVGGAGDDGRHRPAGLGRRRRPHVLRARARSAGAPATAGPSRQVSPPTSPSSTRHTVASSTPRASPRAAATPRTRAASCRAVSRTPGCGARPRSSTGSSRDTCTSCWPPRRNRRRSPTGPPGSAGSSARPLRRARLLADARGLAVARHLQGDLPELPGAPASPGPAKLTHERPLPRLDHRRAVARPHRGPRPGHPQPGRAHPHRRGTGRRPARARPTSSSRPARLREARLDKGIAGKVLTEGGLLVVTWAHGDRLIDSGFRSDHAAEHAAWVDATQPHDQTRRKAHDDDLHQGSRQRFPPYSSWRTAGSSAAVPTGPWGRPSAKRCSPPA